MDELKVGARIAKLRNENNITQLELAEKLGVTDRAVSKWETRGGYPDITLLPQIADIFNVSLDYLLRGTAKVKQKIACFNAWSSQSYEKINCEYLDNGWRIVDLKLCSDGEGGSPGAVILEKEIFED